MRKTVNLKFLEKYDACQYGIDLWKRYGSPKTVADVISCGLNNPDNGGLHNNIQWLIYFAMTRRDHLTFLYQYMQMFNEEMKDYLTQNQKNIWAELEPHLTTILLNDTVKNRKAASFLDISYRADQQHLNAIWCQFVDHGTNRPEEMHSIDFRWTIQNSAHWAMLQDVQTNFQVKALEMILEEYT